MAFFVEKSHKNPDKGAALAVCKVKNRLKLLGKLPHGRGFLHE
jgi:hypothetical protein